VVDFDFRHDVISVLFGQVKSNVITLLVVDEHIVDFCTVRLVGVIVLRWVVVIPDCDFLKRVAIVIADEFFKVVSEFVVNQLVS
jgi:hypothetical protein